MFMFEKSCSQLFPWLVVILKLRYPGRVLNNCFQALNFILNEVHQFVKLFVVVDRLLLTFYAT